MAVSSGDQAWVMASTALVQIMTPGVAFFYSGLVGEDSVLSTLMLSVGSMGVVTVLWYLIGFSMAFGPSTSTGIIGDSTYGTVAKIGPTTVAYSGASTISIYVYSTYQLMFAIVTVAIISGSVAGRIKFLPFMLFVALWHLLVYCPLAHWVFHNGGWLFQYGAVDFAGGLVVHNSAGVAALVIAFWLGLGDKHRLAPHVASNVPYVILGTALLWFGWFGFNAGSALGANYGASLAFTNTQAAGAMGMVAYCFLEVLLPPPPPMRRPSAVADAEAAEAMVRNGSFSALPAAGAHGEAGAATGSVSTPNAGVVAGVGAATGVVKTSSMASAHGGSGRDSSPSPVSKRFKLFGGLPTSVGACTGVVVGLVAVTPAAGYVSPTSALAIGTASALCVAALQRLGRSYRMPWAEDRLDCFLIHAVGGMIGTAMAGLLADSRVSGLPLDGAFFGNGMLFWKQCAAITVTTLYTVIATSILFLFVSFVARRAGAPMRVGVDEVADQVNHGEVAHAGLSREERVAEWRRERERAARRRTEQRIDKRYIVRSGAPGRASASHSGARQASAAGAAGAPLSDVVVTSAREATRTQDGGDFLASGRADSADAPHTASAHVAVAAGDARERG